MFFLGVLAIALFVRTFGLEVDRGVKYEGIGCYKDSDKNRTLPVLLKNFRKTIDWKDEWPSFQRVIRECAKRTQKAGYSYFAIQFYGECWTAKDAYKKFYKKGRSNSCVYGVGKEWANFVYMIITPDRLECSKDVYRELTESSRLFNVSTGFYCDDKITTQGENPREWFRFNGGAGNSLAMHAPESTYCSTLSGGWMKGSLPKEKGTVVHRTVCFPQVPYFGSGDSCQLSVTIKVHNCGHFFVYKLSTPPSCPYRYCGDFIALEDY